MTDVKFLMAVIEKACAEPGTIIRNKEEHIGAFALKTPLPGVYTCFANLFYNDGLYESNYLGFSLHSIYDVRKNRIFAPVGSLYAYCDNYAGEIGYIQTNALKKAVSILIENMDAFEERVRSKYPEEDLSPEEHEFRYSDFKQFDAMPRNEYLTNVCSRYSMPKMELEEIYPFYDAIVDCEAAMNCVFCGGKDFVVMLTKKIKAAIETYEEYQSVAEDDLCYYTQIKKIQKAVGSHKTVHVVLDTKEGEKDVVVKAQEFFKNSERLNVWQGLKVSDKHLIHDLSFPGYSYENIKKIIYKGKTIWESD